ncbi:PIG-L deacetylase family protein [Saccharopolyspora mangrovi]|uniref:PIG-L deacetylase family protein n=1 Tax=Saccharopolyspora mangrovi TaxID=3082379 RepID=A0ABU6AH35_9PSEU|nr:PIG-L deacetylase family protein [Saccharopolyspora sp. S2-29]MEB3370852.1 PIG-L deacetylase family protein [Saccharopolyspora sp. S2-29]
MSMPSLLGVFAHPDDESLSAGGVLACHAQAGARTGVVTATWVQDTPRAAELGQALRILGAGTPRLLGYADARVPESAPGCPRLVKAPLEEAVHRLVAQLREFRPEVVITHDAHDAHGGLSGDPDHVHTHRITVLAVHAAGLDQLYPDTGPAWQPQAGYSVTHPHSELAAHRGLVGRRKAVHTVPDEQVTASVDVAEWLGVKTAAVLAHRSEVQRGGLPAQLGALDPVARRELFGTEHFLRHAVGHLPAVEREPIAQPVTAG